MNGPLFHIFFRHWELTDISLRVISEEISYLTYTTINNFLLEYNIFDIL